jgi:hypothetical protein
MSSYGYSNGGRDLNNRGKATQIMMPDEDEDLYEGFNYSIDLAPPQTASSTMMMSMQQGYFKQGIQNQSSMMNSNNPPGTAFRAPPSQMGRQVPTGRLQTGQQYNGGDVARPMTSVSGAGYSVYYYCI